MHRGEGGLPNKNVCTEGERLPMSSSLPNENAQRGRFTYVGFPAKHKCTEGKAVYPTKMHVQKENVYLCRLPCQTKMHRGGGLPMSASLPNVNAQRGRRFAQQKCMYMKENVYLCRLPCQTKMHRGGGLPMSASLPNVNVQRGRRFTYVVFPTKQNW